MPGRTLPASVPTLHRDLCQLKRAPRQTRWRPARGGFSRCGRLWASCTVAFGAMRGTTPLNETLWPFVRRACDGARRPAGVLNTDNLSILGVTIDFGPYAFIDRCRGAWRGSACFCHGAAWHRARCPGAVVRSGREDGSAARTAGQARPQARRRRARAAAGSTRSSCPTPPTTRRGTRTARRCPPRAGRQLLDTQRSVADGGSGLERPPCAGQRR
jgi:hypothetical protein